MVKAIIFDCFGVLATEAWTAFKAERFGHDVALFEQATEISNRADAGLISHEEAIGLTASLAGVAPAEVIKTMHGNVPNEPLFDYIRELKKNYKIGLLSNAAANWLDRIFTPDQLALFDAVNLSFESGFVKPDQRAYAAMASSLGVKTEECVLVDDNERQCEGGDNCGMKTVLYENFEQTKAELEKLLTDPKG